MQQLETLRQNAQQGTTAIAKQENDPIKGKLMLLDKRKDMLGSGIPGHMMVEREIRSAGIMLMNSRELQNATPASFYTAVSVAINTGIGLGRGMGYLVAYKGNCQYVPGWRGLVDLVSRTGRATVWTGIVRKGDVFDYELGDSPYLKHKPGDSEEHEDITHYYSVGRVKGGEYPLIEVWSVNRVSKHLTKYNKVGEKHYALKDKENFEHYGRKVVLLQVIKYLPQSQEIQNAIAADAAHESGKQNVIDGNMVWIDETGTPAETGGPLAAEVVEPVQQEQQQSAAQEEKAQPAQKSAEQIAEEADFQRSQQAEAQRQAKTATKPAAETAATEAPKSRVRRRTSGAE